MTKKEAIRQTHQENTLMSLGFSREEAEALRRISMTLHRWHERECGDGTGCIERDEMTNKPYWFSSFNARRTPIQDREAGAYRRLRAILAAHPPLESYIQGDPRGAALYIIRPGDVPEGADVDSYYTRGICVY